MAADLNRLRAEALRGVLEVAAWRGLLAEYHRLGRGVEGAYLLGYLARSAGTEAAREAYLEALAAILGVLGDPRFPRLPRYEVTAVASPGGGWLLQHWGPMDRGMKLLRLPELFPGAIQDFPKRPVLVAFSPDDGWLLLGERVLGDPARHGTFHFTRQRPGGGPPEPVADVPYTPAHLGARFLALDPEGAWVTLDTPEGPRVLDLAAAPAGTPVGELPDRAPPPGAIPSPPSPAATELAPEPLQGSQPLTELRVDEGAVVLRETHGTVATWARDWRTGADRRGKLEARDELRRIRVAARLPADELERWWVRGDAVAGDRVLVEAVSRAQGQWARRVRRYPGEDLFVVDLAAGRVVLRLPAEEGPGDPHLPAEVEGAPLLVERDLPELTALERALPLAGLPERVSFPGVGFLGPRYLYRHRPSYYQGAGPAFAPGGVDVLDLDAGGAVVASWWWRGFQPQRLVADPAGPRLVVASDRELLELERGDPAPALRRRDAPEVAAFGPPGAAFDFGPGGAWVAAHGAGELVVRDRGSGAVRYREATPEAYAADLRVAPGGRAVVLTERHYARVVPLPPELAAPGQDEAEA